MLAIKHSVAIAAVLFSSLSTTSNLTSQLCIFLDTQLMGISDKVRVSIRTVPNLLPSHEQPLLSTSNNSRLWGNVNVLTCCDNDKRYSQVSAQAIGDYAVAAMPIVCGGELEADNVELKHGRLDTLPPRAVLDINQLIDTVSLRDLSPDQPTQLTHFRQAWRVRAGQCVNMIASGDGFSANAGGQALNSTAVAQNARVHMTSGQVVSGAIDADENTLINL